MGPSRLLSRRAVRVAALLLLGTAVPAGADEAPLDLSAWQRMPVFDNGRLMPLDSFARSVVKEICGSTSPTFDPSGIPPGASARELFPGGKPRQFDAAELLFSWLVEAEKWEDVPVLIAADATLRDTLLGLPLRSEQRRRLRHVSRRHLLRADSFWQRVEEIRQRERQARAEQRELQLTGVDKHVVKLGRAHTLFRSVTFGSTASAGTGERFFARLFVVIHTWQALEPDLLDWSRQVGRPDTQALIEETGRPITVMAALAMQDKLSVEVADPLLVALRRPAARLAAETRAACREAFDDPVADDSHRATLNRLAAGTAELARVAHAMHAALYDDGRSLRLVPALDPATLRSDRELGDDAQPWLNLQTLLLGSPGLLADYPREELNHLRDSFEQVSAVYLDRAAEDRGDRFAAAMAQFTAAVRALGEKIEPDRRRLPIPGDEHDVEHALALTAYPPPGYTDVEFYYNRADPFLWTWLACLVSVVCMAVSVLIGRRVFFWAGVVTLTLAMGLIAFGLLLRTIITAWFSVTNSFEVIMFVGLSAGTLALWFALRPVLRPGIERAWAATALPEAIRCRRFVQRCPLCRWWARFDRDDRGALAIAPWLLLVPRAALVVGVFVVLTLLPYGSAGIRPIIVLLPRMDLGSSIPSIGSVLCWMAGWCVLLLAIWHLPRLILAAVASAVAVPWSWRGGQLSRAMTEVHRQRWCVAMGAVVALLATVLGYYVPIFDKDIRPLMPILRDNFWLTAHVSSITASYGAAVLAWGLGNVALCYYLFGRYRNCPSAAEGRLFRRPPAACAMLAVPIYKAIQAAVWLLAVGTILGALWGDVAWGRFWAWDPKEVWALISLLVYLAVLHGRSAGWANNFGMTLAALLGTTSIIMAWYGVNYVLRTGLHSYAGGIGGLWYVVIPVLANWLLLVMAAIRYGVETRTVGPEAVGD